MFFIALKTVVAEANRNLVLLPATATLHGQNLQTQGTGANTNIGYWSDPTETIAWDKVQVAQPGTYRLTLETATIFPTSAFTVQVGATQLAATALNTGDWNAFSPLDLGEIQIATAGTLAVMVKPSADAWQAINLRAVRLTRVR